METRLYTINQFCEHYSLKRSEYDYLRRVDLVPCAIHVGMIDDDGQDQPMITEVSIKEWHEQMDQRIADKYKEAERFFLRVIERGKDYA